MMFQKRVASKDGLTASCKDCLRARDAGKHQKARDARLAAMREYARSDKGREVHSKAAKKWREAHPDRRAAQQAIGNAVQSGKVTPLPCFICGAKAEAHHPDYSAPLNVVWLCSSHHKQTHAMAAAF